MTEQIDLFAWLRLLTVALGRKQLHPVRAGVAQFVALDSSGTTGTRATVDAARIGIELGISTRQVWRHVEQLVDEGWLEQTEKPTRGSKGKAGRRARYRLLEPVLDLGLVSDHVTPQSAGTSHDSVPDRVTPSAEQMSHDSEPDAEPCDISDPNRVTSRATSSDAGERLDGTVLRLTDLPTDGTPADPVAASTPDRARSDELDEMDQVGGGRSAFVAARRAAREATP